MNQSRSIYKTDYVPYDWMQNNFSSNNEEFCSPENIDDCVQYISQEFCALGYPSIYLNTNSHPSSVNYDIVTLLNVTFELLGCTKDHAHIKDDYECRNQRLNAELASVNKKNAQLKENAEHLERKYRSVLERERQLKERNEKLTQAIKNEKSEAKKLSSQIQQQKVAYQHEVRKCESSVNQLKTRLKQIIADKNPDKKVVSVSSSNLLQRNSKERGKWKTGTVAKSNMEEMYNSLISTYENRSKDMLREITDYQLCFEFLESELKDLIAVLKCDDEYRSFSNAVPLHVVWSGPNKLKALEERFKILLSDLKGSALEKVNNNLKKFDDGETDAASMISITQELSIGECTKKTDSDNKESESQKNMLELKRSKLHLKEKELAATASLIEKEKANIENQKLEVIKLVMQQDSAKSEWHRNLKSSPSFSVITTKDGLTAVPTVTQLRQCHSAPSQQVKTLYPLWNLESSKDVKPILEDTLPVNVPSTSSEIQDIDFPTSDLPKWAASCLDLDAKETKNEIVVSETLSNEEFDLSNVSLSEEQNLARLKAAFDDMEMRRNHPSC